MATRFPNFWGPWARSRGWPLAHLRGALIVGSGGHALLIGSLQGLSDGGWWGFGFAVSTTGRTSSRRRQRSRGSFGGVRVGLAFPPLLHRRAGGLGLSPCSLSQVRVQYAGRPGASPFRTLGGARPLFPPLCGCLPLLATASVGIAGPLGATMGRTAPHNWDQILAPAGRAFGAAGASGDWVPS